MSHSNPEERGRAGGADDGDPPATRIVEHREHEGDRGGREHDDVRDELVLEVDDHDWHERERHDEHGEAAPVRAEGDDGAGGEGPAATSSAG